jgi:hypothetical protein
MTHRGGFSLSIIIWRIGGGGAKLPFALGPKNSLGGPALLPYNITPQRIIKLLADEHKNNISEFPGINKT